MVSSLAEMLTLKSKTKDAWLASAMDEMLRLK